LVSAAVLKKVEEELRLIRVKLESLEELLAEEMTKEDVKALTEALSDYKKGETISLNDAKRKLL
jgi:hypothetical protein